MRGIRKYLICMLTVLFVAAAGMTAGAARVTTPVRTIGRQTSGDASQVIRTAWGRKNFTLFYQGNRGAFIRKGGCSFCCMASLIGALKPGYAKVTPEYVHAKLEKKALGNVGNASLSVYGQYRLLRKMGIRAKYYKTFNRRTVERGITSHLYKGKPVIIQTSSKNLLTGKRDRRWALNEHILLLLGMTDSGKVIVYDSNNRSWNGKMQRIKLASISELVSHMRGVSGTPSLRYAGASKYGGYMLVG